MSPSHPRRTQAAPAPSEKGGFGHAFVVVHSGARDGYQVARALEEDGALAGLVTDYYSKSGLVGRRHADGIPAHRTHNDWPTVWDLAIHRVGARLGLRRDFDPRRSWRTMGHQARSLAARKRAGVLSYSRGDSSSVFEGFAGPKILFAYHPLHAFTRQILSEDADRFGLNKEAVSPDSWFDERILEAAETQELNSAEQVLCASSFTRESLGLAQATSVPTSVVPYGCPPPLRSMDESRSRDFLFVGQGVQRKGVHHLLRVWPEVRRKHPRATLTMVMGSVDPAMLPNSVPDGVLVRDRVGRDELTYLRHQHRVLVLPSLAEGFGLVIPEALAHGMHVVASTNTGLVDVPDYERCGTVVAAGDCEQLRDALCASYDATLDPEDSYSVAAQWQWADFRAGIRRALKPHEEEVVHG